MIDVQQEIITNMREKNILLAVVHMTKAALHTIAMKTTLLEDERKRLMKKLERKKEEKEIAKCKATYSIDAAKEEVDIYIEHLDQKVTTLTARVSELDSEILELKKNEQECKAELEEKEASIAELEKNYETLEQQLSDIYSNGISPPPSLPFSLSFSLFPSCTYAYTVIVL